MVSWLKVVLVVLVLFCMSTEGVLAGELRCGAIAGQQVCLESIKRSAKYPWEYRVITRVEGVRQSEKSIRCPSPARVENAPQSPEAQLQTWVCGLLKPA